MTVNYFQRIEQFFGNIILFDFIYKHQKARSSGLRRAFQKSFVFSEYKNYAKYQETAARPNRLSSAFCGAPTKLISYVYFKLFTLVKTAAVPAGRIEIRPLHRSHLHVYQSVCKMYLMRKFAKNLIIFCTVKITLICRSPLCHRIKNRLKAVSCFRQGVFHAGRNLRIDLSRQQLILLH